MATFKISELDVNKELVDEVAKDALAAMFDAAIALIEDEPDQAQPVTEEHIRTMAADFVNDMIDGFKREVLKAVAERALEVTFKYKVEVTERKLTFK